jgi:tetratricopeptide (TPR) repeat protein
MRRTVAPWFLALGLVCACDQIEALREKILGGGGADAGNQRSPEFQGAIDLYESGQLQAAADQLQTVILTEPGNADAFYHMGRCYLGLATATGDPASDLSPEEAQSLDAFNTALTLNPRHADAAMGIGDLYARRVPTKRSRRKSQEPEAQRLARAAYQKAVTIDPKQPESQRRYATFLERLGQMEDAEVAHKAAVDAAKINPDLAPEYYTAYGRFLAPQKGRSEEAIDQLELAQMVRGEDPVLQGEIAALYSRMGHEYFDEKHYSLAEQTLTKAYKMFPDKSDPDAQKTSATLNRLRAIRGR